MMFAFIKTSTVSTAILVAGVSFASAQPIRVLGALYGDLAAKKVCNAGPAIAGSCDGRARCTVPISNGLCGDSDFLVVKAAAVSYQCGRGRPHVLTSSEYTSATIACE